MDDQIPVIADFRCLIENELQAFMNASQQLGEPIYGLANMVKRAFRNLLSFIIDGVYMERPDEAKFQQMIHLLAKEISDIGTFKETNRNMVNVFNHTATISESIVALSWITISPAPVPFIREMRDAGQYFGNRVLSQFKGDPLHQNWINKWNQVMAALEAYVKLYHMTGFHWNVGTLRRNYGRPDGTGEADVALRQMGVPPPPPPPPPAMDLIPEGGDNRQHLQPEGAEDRQNLLRDLNQGVDIVRMLKPVNKQQPSQSQQSSPSTSGALPKKPVADRVYPPKLLLDGRKWRVEHQKDRYDLVIEDAEMSHSLAMFKCQNSGLEVRNKLNGVSIDNCKRATVVLSDIISSVELIGCQHVKLQCTGHVPLISVDNCDSVEIYLIDKSFDAEIISSKSTSLNVSLMKPDGDYVELAVPEQIKTVVVDRKLVSTVVEKN